MIHKNCFDVRAIDYDCSFVLGVKRSQIKISILARQIDGSAIAINVEPTQVIYSAPNAGCVFNVPYSYSVLSIVRRYLKLCLSDIFQMYYEINENGETTILLSRDNELLTLICK